MRSLTLDYLQKQQISLALAQSLRQVGEIKGQHDLYVQQRPELLDSLKKSAAIESVESSNRIEGIEADPERLKDLVNKGGVPTGRSEQEIAGYRDVLATVHTSFKHIPITPNTILQFHRDLYRFVGDGDRGGHWKASDNAIAETQADGTRFIRFQPTPAWQTPEAMQQLCDNYRTIKESGVVDPLLLIPAFVLDFLCIHPFSDGNGRMSRLLTLLLLYQDGFEVGRYISLERVIEQQKEGYYETLHAASQGWHESQHRLTRWWEYLTGVVILSAYREFASRSGAITLRRGAKREQVIDVIHRLGRTFRYADIEKACPDVSRPTIMRVLEELKAKAEIRPTGRGPAAAWEKIHEPETTRN
jgi:Fic family protein